MLNANTCLHQQARMTGNLNTLVLALVVGIDNYDGTVLSKLDGAVNDARAVKDALESKGVGVVFIENCSIKELKEIKDKFLKMIQPGDVVLIYFAGHGCRWNNYDRLLAISQRSDGKIDYKLDALNLLLLQTNIEDKGAMTVAILDCCTSFEHEQIGRPRGLGGGGTSLTARACATNAESFERKGQGLYTKWVLKYFLSTPNMDLREMLNQVGDEVKKESKGRQNPSFEDGTHLRHGELILFN